MDQEATGVYLRVKADIEGSLMGPEDSLMGKRPTVDYSARSLYLHGLRKQ